MLIRNVTEETIQTTISHSKIPQPFIFYNLAALVLAKTKLYKWKAINIPYGTELN